MSDNLKYVDFSGDFKKYLNTRPVSICCFKREESVEDWSDVFVAVCRGLYMHHPLRFDKTTGSHKFQAIVSRSDRKLLCPRQFSQFRYCETDLSLPEILGWIRQLADGLGVRYELIQIQVQELPPETLENCTQAESCRWICDGIERLRRHGNVLDFKFDMPSYVYAYTKPVSLTVRTTDGLFQTGTPFDKLCYQFDNWQDIVERIMAWMTLIDAEFLVDGLKHDCDAAITQAISFSYTQMKRPFLLHEHEYIDLEVFDNHIVLCIETLCAIADRAELTPNDLRITFEIDEEKLNSMLAEEADEADEADEVDAADEADEVDAAEVDEDEVEADETDESEAEYDEVDAAEVDAAEVDAAEVDDDEIDEDDDEDDTILVNWDGDLDRYADTKLVKFNIDGTEESSDSWDDLIKGFCKPKYDALKALDDALWQSIDRRYMNKRRKELKNPYELGYGVCIELELQAHEILKMLKQIMEILGEDCQKLQINVCRDTPISVCDGLGVSCTSTPKQQTVAQNYVVRRVYDPSQPMDAINRVSLNNHNPYATSENLNSGYSRVMQIDFKHLEGGYYHTRPIFISCFGVENNSIKTWKDAFVEVVRDIYDHKHDFIITNAPKWFAGKIGIAYTADNIRRPVQIARNVYLETNYSSLDILRMIKRLMDISGIPYHQCVICYTQKNDQTLSIQEGLDIAPQYLNSSEGRQRSKSSVEKPNSCRIVDSYREFVLSAAGTAKLSPIDLGKKHVPRKIDEKLLAVLRQTNGYTLGEYRSQMKFENAYERTHGEACHVSGDDLDNAIKQAAFVVGSECYALDSVFESDKKAELLEFVRNTLNREDVPCLWYEAIFEHFDNYHQARLETSENLRKYLHATMEEDWVYYADFCAKSELEHVPNLVELLQSYLRDYGQTSWDDLGDVFCYLPKTKLENCLTTHEDVFLKEKINDDIYWSLIEFVDLDETQLKTIAQALSALLEECLFVSWTDLLEHFKEQEHDDLVEFLVEHENTRVQVLQAHLGEAFKFEKKGISKVGERGSLRELISNTFDGRKKVLLDEIQEFIKHHNLTDGRQPSVFEYFYRKYCRISYEEFVSWDGLEFDVTRIDSELEHVCKRDYMPLKHVPLHSLPYVGHPWNIYLLAQYLYSKSQIHSQKFDWKAASYLTTKTGCGGVMVKNNSRFNHYDEVCIDYLELQMKLKNRSFNTDEAMDELKDGEMIFQATKRFTTLYEEYVTKRGK